VLLDELASAVRAGHSIPSALKVSVEQVEGPLSSDLEAVCARLDTGLPLAGALQQWAADHPKVRSIQIVAAALTLAATSGGTVASAIESVAETVRSELAIQAETSALASQAYASAVLVALLPVFFATVAAATDPGTVRFFLGSRVGLACLVLGTATDAAGWYWMRRIIKAANPT